jgi:ABC-type amino acid transport system permease subunit
VLPQALRVIIPPSTSQFLNLFKNSSLSVAIGYPDLMSITNTTLNQTGQAIEAIALAMVVYLVVLPQALRVSIPPLVNTFITLFKDTSLVIVIGLFDLLGAAKAVIVDPKWVGFGVEVYLFTAAVYFLFCFVVSRFSLRLERELQRARAA